MKRLLLIAVLLLFPSTISAQQVSFTMNENFLRSMMNGNSIQPTLRVKMTAHGPLHTLANDCEMHVAGTVQNVSIGRPPAIVVEFPNWCKFAPDGSLPSSTSSLSTTWANLMDAKVINKTCDVKGFLRIFCEHCVGGGSGGSNPNHAYEFHPAMSMTCGSENFEFGNMLRAFPGLRHISTGTASNCISGRELSVRFKNNRYEFHEEGGGSCGNFAIVKVLSVDLSWTFAIGGGHYAFADVTADGSDTGGLGIYTLSGSEPDSWLTDVMQQGGSGNTNKVIHGVFTYDWQAIFYTLRDTTGDLRKPANWERIDFPLALIAYGETTAPF